MRKDIHPEYNEVVFQDATSGFQFITRSTKKSKETIEINGVTYPLIKVEISSDTHPFFTGAVKSVERGGRAEKFKAKYNLK